jgi:hypothetical protein
VVRDRERPGAVDEPGATQWTNSMRTR